MNEPKMYQCITDVSVNASGDVSLHVSQMYQCMHHRRITQRHGKTMLLRAPLALPLVGRHRGTSPCDREIRTNDTPSCSHGLAPISSRHTKAAPCVTHRRRPTLLPRALLISPLGVSRRGDLFVERLTTHQRCSLLLPWMLPPPCLGVPSAAQYGRPPALPLGALSLSSPLVLLL